MKNSLFLPLLAILLVMAVLSCFFIYRYDNKYTAQGPQALNGVLLLDEQALGSYPIIYLIHGWEFYNGRLLSPEDFTQNPPLPDEYIFIGQYGGFEAGDLSSSPHGSASYRLNVIIPEKVRTYMLELPEIFSAYRIYINGKEAAGLGNPEPSAYAPETGNRTVSFEAQNRIEILVAVSDFSHFYSGMVYPPAFGSPDSVSQLLSARLVFRSVLCSAALVIGLLAVLIGLLSGKNSTAVLYGLMCLFFVGYTCYPVIKTLTQGFYPLYAIENFSFCAMFVVIMMLQVRICGIKNRLNRYVILFGLLVCLPALIMPFVLPYGNLGMMVFYSNMITVYKWVTAAFITVTAVWSVLKKSVYSKTLLCGILVFDCALVMDRFLPMHEPIVTGWFSELAGFVLILSVGVVIGREVAAEYAKSAIFEERARSIEKLSDMQRTYYPLLREKIEEAKAARHDIHHHLVVIGGFLENRQYDRLETYVAEYRTSVRNKEPVSYSQNDVADVLAHHYVRLAEKHGIELTLRLDIDSETKVSDADLCGLLSNLLENAAEACMRQTSGRRFISLSVVHKKSAIAVHMENSGGDVMQSASGFLSSKGKGRKGYGLDSVKAIAGKYAGAAEFRYDEAAQVFISTVLLSDL